MFWVSKSIFILRLTYFIDLGGIRSVMRWISRQENALFDGQKKWNFFKIFEILKISLDFTDLRDYQFCALQWLLGIQKVCHGYIKVSPTSIGTLGWFWGYRKRYEVDFEAGKFTFRWWKNFPKFLRFPNFPWILQIWMVINFEPYSESWASKMYVVGI